MEVKKDGRIFVMIPAYRDPGRPLLPCSTSSASAWPWPRPSPPPPPLQHVRLQFSLDLQFPIIYLRTLSIHPFVSLTPLSECQHTLRDLLAKAEVPERVRVAVCFQEEADHDQDCFTAWPEEKVQGQIRLMRIPAAEAKGPCWARHRCQSLYEGEEFTLSLDSHMRFIPKWDTVLLTLLAKCPSQKPVLTAYPPGYELPNKLSTSALPSSPPRLHSILVQGNSPHSDLRQGVWQRRHAKDRRQAPPTPP